MIWWYVGDFFTSTRRERGVDPVDAFAALLGFEDVDHPQEDPCEHLRVVAGAVVVEVAQPEVLGDEVELVLLSSGNRERERMTVSIAVKW